MSMVGRKGVYPQVVVNLYKVYGSTSGSNSYQDYHQKLFQNLPALTKNGNRWVITGEQAAQQLTSSVNIPL